MARGTAELEATAAVEAVVAPDEASAELRAAALREFTPLTFAITSSTPDMVNVEAIIDFIRRDDAFANVLFIVEAMRASTRDGPAAKAGGGGGSARQRGSAGAKHAPPEGAKSSATALRAEYVRIAEDREKERRRLIEEREKELDALRVQYVEDGMTEEEAAKAAEEDMREMEEAQMDDEDEDADDRKPLFFCVRDFPHTLEDVVESNRAELPLHVLVDVRSNIPLIGSTGYVLREQADTKTTNNAKDAHRMRAPSKHSRGVEEHSIAQLPQLLLERQETRVVTDYGPLDEVFVCRYDFPVETIPSMVSPEAPPTYRATMTEKAAFAQVRDVLLQLEEHLFRYREWRNRRAVLPVPAYAPLPNPDAPKLPPVEEVDEKRPPSRSRSRSQGGKKNAAVKVEEVVSIIPQTTAPNPATMAEVAAHQERYDAFLREHRKSVAHVDVRAFVEACKAQLSATEPQNLLTKAQLDEKAMQLHREGVERFAHYVFDRVMGPLPPPKPAATTTDMPIKASGATLSPALLARMSKAKTPAPTTTNTQAAPAVQFVTAPTDAAAPAGDPAGAADAAAPPPPKLLTPEEEAAAEAEVAQRLAPAPLSEVDAEQLSQVVAVVVGELSPELNPDVARQLTAQLMSYLLVSLDGQSDPIVAQFLRYKNRKAWRENEVVWGPHRLHVFSRGDGSTRTQHSAYSFEGPTTFPEYISQIHFCEGEGLYFYPPPPDSDADEPEMDEAEESEEDEEDEEGNIIPRKRKEPEPLPHIDHVTVVQRAMRRRRVYEEIRSYATRPCLQELMCMGRGARGAVEEVEWMLPADGCLIEVERSVANTLQLACSVLPLRGLDCGFFYTPETESDVVADHVPSRVRSYVALGREVQLFSEVVADNRVAAELAAYEAAVVAAKAEAKTQFESLNVRTRSGRSKDKNAPPPPTLAGLEEACIKAIPVPKQRSRCLPSLHLSAVVNEGACSLVYHEEHSMLEVVQNFPVNHVELTLRVWRGGAVDRIHLSSIRKVLLYTSGMMEVVSDDAEGYRILLGSRGSYLTSKDDTCLSISEAGDCVVRTRRQVVRLAPLKRSTCVDASSKCQRQSSLREDGMVSVMEQQALVSVKYSDSVAVRWEDGECRWSVRGLPDLVSCASTTAQYLGLDCGQSGQLRFDLVAHTAVLSFAHDDFRAHYDFVEYQLHVRPSSAVSFYTIDCAFGGLHASLQVPEEVVYRVSPHGRCSEERGGLVVTPPTYTTPEAQPLLRYREVLSQRFLEALTDTEVLLDRDALHRMESFSTELAMPAIAITSGADASVARPAIAGKSLMEAQCTSQAIAAVDSLLHLKTAPRRCLLAATVSPSTGLAGPITLAEPAMARILSEEWCRRVHPLRTCPRRVEEGSSVLREDLLALSPANTSAAQTLGKSSLPRRTGAVGTREDPSTSDSAVAAAAASGPCVEWYLVCQPNNAPTENPAPIGQDFFTAELQTDRVKRLVAEATADIEKTLPLSLRAEKVEAAAPTPSIPDEEVAAAAVATAATDLDVSHPTATALFDLPDGVSVDDAPTTAAPLIDHRLNYWASCHAPEKVVPLNPIPRREQPEPKRPRTKAPAPHPLRVAADEDAPIPLMLSHLTPADSALGNNDTGTTAATRGHAPNLLLQPSVVDFGTVKTRRRYGVVAQLTNPSTVPCRYRCVVAAGAKGVVSLRYPRHFIAPGLTEGIEVRLSGMQPIGPMEATILVRHEGGSSKLTARWTTTEDEEKVRLQPAAFCLGTSLAPFVPGVSLRLTNRRDSDLYEESVHESNASSDDDDDAPPLSCI